MTRPSLRLLTIAPLWAVYLVMAMVGCSPSKQATEAKQTLASRKTPATAGDENFRAALTDDSTNTWFVLITVTDSNTGRTKTGCTAANFLIGAIHREYGLGYDPNSHEKGRKLALAAAGHVFVFTKPDALANVGFDKFESQYPEECGLIREGWTAMRGDIGYGLFTNKPGYRRVDDPS